MLRVVCTACQILTEASTSEQQAYSDVMNEKRTKFVQGAGCNICAQTGYQGRSGVFEILTVTDDLRQLFLNDAPRHELYNQALSDGMITLKEDAMMKVQHGITTPLEVMRVMFALE